MCGDKRGRRRRTMLLRRVAEWGILGVDAIQMGDME
jgi:hypothetical protein